MLLVRGPLGQVVRQLERMQQRLTLALGQAPAGVALGLAVARGAETHGQRRLGPVVQFDQLILRRRVLQNQGAKFRGLKQRPFAGDVACRALSRQQVARESDLIARRAALQLRRQTAWPWRQDDALEPAHATDLHGDRRASWR
jgi:hypothetical protein